MSPPRASSAALPGALCAAALTACVSLGPSTPSTRYELQAVFDGQPVTGPGPALVVAQPTAAPGFDGSRIVYVEMPHKLEFFSRSEWVDTPARMLAPLLVRALERSGTFASVAQARSAVAAGLRLEAEIVRLQQEFTERPSRVRLTVRIQLSDVPSRRVLGAREIEAVEGAPSDDPYGGVVAANRAVRRVLDEIVAYCGERAVEHASAEAPPRATTPANLN
jgi:cholesterol transport system auxiliary component